MPRGPGKKENYNFDYSRFEKCVEVDDEEESRIKASKKAEQEADAAGGPQDTPPDMEEMLRAMPPDLQDAYRHMAVAKATGDERAHKKATELALKAVQQGNPQVKRDFIQQIGKQMPEVARDIAEEMSKAGDKADIPKILEGVSLKEGQRQTRKAQATPAANNSVEAMSSSIDQIKAQMEEGREATRKQMEELTRQQEQLERLKSPEDFFKFMSENGMTEQDLQRMFAGDQSHMEKCVNQMMDKDLGPPTASAEAAVKAAEDLHSSIFGTGSATEPPASEAAAPARAAPARAEAPKAPEPQVLIPEYTLQYQRDADGRYLSVELKVSLPGVADMSGILLDVSEKHLRLNTLAPAPSYAVNAGPFPVLIEPTAARAKFSKKRSELSVSVPAKSS